jgi:hypothetical protein
MKNLAVGTITIAKFQKMLADFESGNFSGGPKASGVTKDAGDRQSAQDKIFQEDKEAKDRLAAEVARIEEEQATKLELELQFHFARQAILEEALAQRLLTQEKFDDLMEQENQDHQNRLTELDRRGQIARLSAWAGVMGNIANVFEQGNEKMFKIAKVFSTAQGLLDAYGAYLKALNDPTVPSTLARIALAAKVLAMGMKMVSSIKSVGKGGSRGSGAGGGGSRGDAGSVAASGERSSITAVNINVRGQVFDRGAVVGLISQINEAIGDGARIRAT